MTAQANTTSRRAILGALAATPLLAATTATAATEQGDLMEFADGYNDARDETLAIMAAAWIDRWTSIGGHFAMCYNADGSERGMTRGMPMSYVWTPPSCADALARNPKLRPHEVILQRADHEGAQKMLESFLTLVPGLERAVWEQAGPLINAGVAEREAAIAAFLKSRGA